MISRITTLLFFSFSHVILAQWAEIGQIDDEVIMVKNEVGYRVTNTVGPTPSNGITFKIYRTESDWSSEALMQSGGGTLGCCNVEGLSFFGDSNGILLRNNMGIISVLETSDAGNNWNQNMGSISNFLPNNSIMVNDSTVFLAGNAHSTGGIRVNKINNSNLEVYASDTLSINPNHLNFYYENIGYFIAQNSSGNSFLFRTLDSGLNWELTYSTSIGIELINVTCPTSTTVIIGTSAGEIIKSSNNGDSWSNLISPINAISSIAFYTDSFGYVAGVNGDLYLTIDGGLSWNQELYQFFSNIKKFFIFNEFVAYALDENNYLYKNSALSSLSELENNVMLHPNPTDGMITIETMNGINHFTVFNQLGEIVLTGKNTKIDATQLSSGVYMISIELENENRYLKFIKN